MVLLTENKTLEVLSDCSNCTQAVVHLNITKAIILGVVLGIFIFLGFLGNIMVILSVACHRHLQTVTHYFIVNLAIADLLLTSTVLPFSATFEILGYWTFGRIFCDVWAAVDVLCCTASIMSLCVISIDRYIGVSYPLRHATIVTKRRAVITLVGLWALSLVISIGPLFGWKEPAPKDDTICKITQEPGYALFSAFGSFYLPLVIILVMYCRVYIVAKRETRGLLSGMKTDKSDSDAVTLRIHCRNLQEDSKIQYDSKSKTHFSIRFLKFSREKKAAKTLGIVVGCFILCWLPFFLVLPIGSIFPHMKASDTVFKITFWLGYFNSCLNPIIYPCSSQEFKKAFLNILRARCSQRKPPAHQCTDLQDLVQLPTGSGETFYKISSSERACKWKLFTPRPGGEHAKNITSTDQSRWVCANVRSKTFLHMCCCVNVMGEAKSKNCHMPIPKMHMLSLSENGEAV
ncbi:alpha-1A adrenergic receptor [Latimeria chalumnae]|uniref:Alpha-1A adrenergic receptor n=1 Tax=Latimeria chalumnae TaxID=7897 RepID=H2ZWR0_LATCH|nr:PREDICTED: alpha-1A adrenergic receptor [Latimeria chalumnae]|eukprot:XP_006002909.1 PREDICTED: alpha-1A adrenergic receptor [Latimeria chalumnae]